MEELDRLFTIVHAISGMERSDFDISAQYWQQRTYKKGEFYNVYKNVCKHLGFILDGVFRIYKYQESTGTEKNILFFGQNQFMSSFKSFLTQTGCEYYTESMNASNILYIHYDNLQLLYAASPAWERFGRIFAEAVLDVVLTSTEDLLFKTPEDRYREMVAAHPDLMQAIPLYHIASYLGIEGPSLSRIRKRMLKAS